MKVPFEEADGPYFPMAPELWQTESWYATTCPRYTVHQDINDTHLALLHKHYTEEFKVTDDQAYDMAKRTLKVQVRKAKQHRLEQEANRTPYSAA